LNAQYITVRIKVEECVYVFEVVSYFHDSVRIVVRTIVGKVGRRITEAVHSKFRLLILYRLVLQINEALGNYKPCDVHSTLSYIYLLQVGQLGIFYSQRVFRKDIQVVQPNRSSYLDLSEVLDWHQRLRGTPFNVVAEQRFIGDHDKGLVTCNSKRFGAVAAFDWTVPKVMVQDSVVFERGFH